MSNESEAHSIKVKTSADLKKAQENLANKIHKFPKVWLAVTVVVVVASLVLAGVFLKRAYIDDDTTTTANNASSAPAEATTTESKISEAAAELKDIDLAALKASINEVKAVIDSFSAQ